MDDIWTPFCVVNPARYENHSLSSPLSHSTRSEVPLITASTLQELHLTSESRHDITTTSIYDAKSALNECRREQGNPVVLQSRRGIFRVQTQNKRPSTSSQVVRVSSQEKKKLDRQSFESITLNDEDPDLTTLSAIVTEPRRRDLRKVTLSVYGEDSESVKKPYLTGYGLETVSRLFQILSAWDADYPLTVRLNIEPQKFSLLEFQADLINLPVVPVIGSLHINMDPHDSSELPLALLQLLRKLPQLTAATLRLSPWRCSNATEQDLRIQYLADDLRMSTPNLRQLELTIPFFHRQSELRWQVSDILTGRPISTVRGISYRLQILNLDSSIDLNLFFEHFHTETENGRLTTCPSWPALQTLMLHGSIDMEGNVTTKTSKDRFLKVVGRAARHMPRLQNLSVKIDSQPFVFSKAGQMLIRFGTKSFLEGYQDLVRFRLSVKLHTPSSSAVTVWEQALLHTKRLQLAVEFQPAPTFDEDGEKMEEKWQEWEE